MHAFRRLIVRLSSRIVQYVHGRAARVVGSHNRLAGLFVSPRVARVSSLTTNQPTNTAGQRRRCERAVGRRVLRRSSSAIILSSDVRPVARRSTENRNNVRRTVRSAGVLALHPDAVAAGSGALVVAVVLLF